MVHWNGRPSGIGATFILAFFGFGLCVYDEMTRDGEIVSRNCWGVGFFRFVPDPQKP